MGKFSEQVWGESPERRHRTRATVNQLLDRCPEVVELEKSTRRTYDGYIERHIRPVLGHLRH